MHLDMVYGIANILTLIRILITPLLVGVYYFLPEHWGMPLAAVLFGVASVTDWLDGYLARKLDQVSKLGAFLDPIADKLIIITVLVMIVDRHGQLLHPDSGADHHCPGAGWFRACGNGCRNSASVIPWPFRCWASSRPPRRWWALLFLLYYYPVLGIPVFEIGMRVCCTWPLGPYTLVDDDLY